MRFTKLLISAVLLLMVAPLFADPVAVGLLPAGTTYSTGGSFSAGFASNNPNSLSSATYVPSSGFLLTFGSACASKFGSSVCKSGSYVIGGEAKGDVSTPVSSFDAPFRLITTGKLTGTETSAPTYQKVGSTYNVTLAGSQVWTLTPPNDSTFYWGSIGCETSNTCLLIATVDLMEVEQVAGTRATVFNNNLTADVTATGGLLKNYFLPANSPTLQLTLNFNSNTNLEKLMGNKQPVTAFWSTSANSSGSITTTPEPASMFMLGSGLLGIAGMRRRRTKR